jgi:hypothetical protein
MGEKHQQFKSRAKNTECGIGIVVGVLTEERKRPLRRGVTMVAGLEGGGGQSITITMQGVARDHQDSITNQPATINSHHATVPSIPQATKWSETCSSTRLARTAARQTHPAPLLLQ